MNATAYFWYFDNVQHERLLREVRERVEQPDFLALIEQWISVGVLTPKGLLLPQKGVPQGAVVSPILANVYLDDFDEIWADTKLKLVRFADDFVLLGKHEQQVTEAREQVAELLMGMGLELHSQKTRITNFDRGFRFLGHAFAGDLIVPLQRGHAGDQALANQRPEEAEPSLIVRYAEGGSQPTQMQKALVESLKTANKPIPPPLFVVLGYQVRSSEPIEIESREFSWRDGMSTLYLVKQGMALRKEQARFWVKAGSEGQQSEEVEVPIREVERVLVFGNIQLSTAVVGACLENRIPVVFLSQLGDYKGHLWSGEFCDLPVEAAQFGRRNDRDFQLQMARQIIKGKLTNSKQLLLRLNRKRKVEGLAAKVKRLDQQIGTLAAIADLNQLRGHEGAAAALYFGALGQLITNSGFSFEGRNRRPPRDPVNSLLSFGYTLLFNNVLSLILAEGMNPYLGNLHRSDRKEPHLAFDLMEEFRSPIVDSLVMKLINKRMLRPTDFCYPTAEGGVYLEEPGRRIFLKYFEEQITEEVAHAAVQQKVSYRRAIQLQVQHYKRCLIDSVVYEPFIRTT
ncbi:CRISPR-associated endonuclease Cas1 [Phormidesmis priestleyi]